MGVIRSYTYFKTSTGSEVIHFDDIRVEQPFFNLISDMTQPNFKVQESDRLLQLSKQWQLSGNLDMLHDDLTDLKNDPNAPLFQRLFAYYYLNLKLRNDLYFLDELNDYPNVKQSTSVALMDFVDILLNESNPNFSEINLNNRFKMLLSASSAKEILDAYLSNGYHTGLELIKNELVEVIYAGNPVSLMLSVVQYYLSKKTSVKRCKNCDRYYIPVRLSQDYCDYIAPGYVDKTCRDIGATKSFSEKMREDEAYQLYSKYYKRLYRSVSTGKLSKEIFQEWNMYAVELRDAVQNDIYSMVQMAEFMQILFDNYVAKK